MWGYDYFYISLESKNTTHYFDTDNGRLTLRSTWRSYLKNVWQTICAEERLILVRFSRQSVHRWINKSAIHSSHAMEYDSHHPILIPCLNRCTYVHTKNNTYTHTHITVGSTYLQYIVCMQNEGTSYVVILGSLSDRPAGRGGACHGGGGGSM